MSKISFRPFVPPPGSSNVGATAREHAAALVKVELIQNIFAGWKEMFDAPFKGITTDGVPIRGLFRLRAEKAPSEPAIIATHHLLGLMSAEQKAKACFDIDSRQWRNWQNTEIYVETHGLRLAEQPVPVRDAILAVLRASLSAKGYQKTRDVMRLNGYLGEVLDREDVLGEWSFIFCLFGTPSSTEPWGWQLFGHHLCLNALFIGGQMTITPTFMGAEPAFADSGALDGLALFEDEERAGLALMRSFSPNQQAQALIAHSMVGGDLPEGRRVRHDGLHLGGAYCDNRIVPYEGLKGSDLSPIQQRDLLDLAEKYIETLPSGPLAARLSDIERHMYETHFCWIGGRSEDNPFYYRIQSPVILAELDHHAGVFLNNSEPRKFHVHTLVRTPNGNDYGIDLIRQHYERSPHHRHDGGD